jgi:hypothetical protein
VRTVRLTGRWRDVTVPVAPGAEVRPVLRVSAAGTSIAVRDLGRWVRRVPLRVEAAGRSGRRVVVRGTLTPAGAGLRVRLRVRGRDLARARARADGRFTLRAVLRGRARPGGRALVVLAPTRVTLGGAVRVRQLETKRG